MEPQRDESWFLDDGQSMAYVLNPFSICKVRDSHGDHDAAAMRLARVAAVNLEIAYGEVMAQLRGRGAAPASQPFGSGLLASRLGRHDFKVSA
jgi:hypothetical protein